MVISSKENSLQNCGLILEVLKSHNLVDYRKSIPGAGGKASASFYPLHLNNLIYDNFVTMTIGPDLYLNLL